MKYYIALLILFLTMIYGIFTELPMIVNMVLSVVIIVLLILWEYSVLKNKFPANFTIRSQNKSFDKSNLFLTILWSFTLVPNINEEGLNTIHFLVLVLWILIILLDVIMCFIYKKKKPTTIFIDDDLLIFNNRWVKKRDLKDLNYIGITKLWNELELGFEKKSDVRIPYKEYRSEEFRQFLEMLVEKSEHNVYLTDNVLKEFPSPISE